MRITRLSYALTATDADGICLSQTPLAGGALTIAGALASGGTVTLASAQHITITAAANDSARTFTITGTDRDGNSVTKTMAGPNATTSASTFNLKTITGVSVDAATAGAITVGIVDVGETRPIVLDQYAPDFLVSIAGIVSGTVNYTVQYTYDDVFSASFDEATATWWSITALAAKAANTDTALTAPVVAIRTKINSGTGTVNTVVVQSGIAGN